jgi:hypothetical protein
MPFDRKFGIVVWTTGLKTFRRYLAEIALARVSSSPQAEAEK